MPINSITLVGIASFGMIWGGDKLLLNPNKIEYLRK